MNGLIESSGTNRSARARLRDYLAETRRIPRLGAEEEIELVKKAQQDPNSRACDRLIEAHLYLPALVAMEFSSDRIDPFDLVQDGNEGLVIAVARFDAERGVRFSTYAKWWVRAYVIRSLVNNHSSVRVGTTRAQRKIFFNLNRVEASLRRQGLHPSPALLARALGVKAREVSEMKPRLRDPVRSLDAPRAEDPGSTWIDILPSEEVSVEEDLSERELLDQCVDHLRAFGETLDGRDLVIWEKRLTAADPKTLRALGDEFGVSRQRVSQVERRLKKKLRTFLSSRGCDGDKVSQLAA